MNWTSQYSAEMANPEQQGLKLTTENEVVVPNEIAEMANPEQQGLKPITGAAVSLPRNAQKWLIQNNKD